jgi:hypothetical protein
MSGPVNIVADVRKRDGATDPSATAFTTMALRSVLEAAVMRAALNERYAQYPAARPDLADIAIATAELDGNPLAAAPDRIRRVAAEIAARHPWCWTTRPSRRSPVLVSGSRLGGN